MTTGGSCGTAQTVKTDASPYVPPMAQNFIGHIYNV